MAGVIMLAARWVIAGIFLRSGMSKVTDLAEFRSAVANYQLLPSGLVGPVAVVLPFAEIAAAVLLAAGVLPVVVCAALGLLLLAFAAAIAVNLARGRVFDCGCGGSVTPRLIGWPHVAMDLLLAAIAAAVAVAPPPVNAWPGPAGLVRVAAPDGGALPVLLAVMLGMVVTAVLRRAWAVRALAAEARRSFH